MEASVRCEIFVKAEPDRVFDAFTDAGEMLSWFADGAVVGRRVDGNWGLGWYADEESDEGTHVLGTFEIYEPGVRIVVRDLTFSTPEGESWEGMRLSVDLAAEEGGTRVTVVQGGVGEGASWDGYTAGLGPAWERSLADLRAWLEEGRKLPGR
ncbi:MAG TPA: SRPBCC domain-containing protein [Thermoanaerobaculia bacterium]|nr:SRPBCC domain-containing protein [Thermoanaerobaculia bacterium]